MFSNHVSAVFLGRFYSFNSMTYSTTSSQQRLKFFSIWSPFGVKWIVSGDAVSRYFIAQFLVAYLLLQVDVSLNSSFMPLHWPVDSLQRYVAARAGTRAEGGLLTGKAVCTRIMLFGRACIRTQKVNGSSIQKQANAYTSGSWPSARIYTTASITHAATLLLELLLSPNDNLPEVKYKYILL